LDDALPPAAKREFKKPSWLKKPSLPNLPKPRTCNFNPLAIVLDAFSRIPRFKLPTRKEKEEKVKPDVEPAQSINRFGARFDKVKSLLKKKPTLELHIPSRDTLTKSRFSMSPVTTPIWKKLSIPSVIITPEPPKKIEVYERTSPVSVRFSVQSTTPLIPLRPNGDYQLAPPKRWKAAAAESQSTDSTPKLVKFQFPLTTPSASLLSQHSRSPTPRGLPKTPAKFVPLESQKSWRVTNAVPADSLSVTGSFQNRGDGNAYNNKFPARTSRIDVRDSALNPFITPFDDECRVRIEEPSLEGLRKSVYTGS